MNKKRKILLIGHLAYDPLGRHMLAFISSLVKNKNNILYLDKNYLSITAKNNQNDHKEILNKYFSKEIKDGQINYSSELPQDYNYDFFIFTDSLSTEMNFHWEDYWYSVKANIKICYPVFDGSMPPLHWVDIINKHFDICATPSQYCANNLKRFGVKIDCIGLECGVLIDEYLKIKPAISKDKFRFGSIGASDFRKNIPLLIKNFAEVFTKDDDVELYIHSSYGKDITCGDEIKRIYEQYKDKANIILKTEKISQEEMNNLWESFDAYISPQTTTGYFTTPLEACAVGIPVILSDIEPHKELKKFVDEKNNLFFVNHNKPALAFHWAFNYKSLGCLLNASENSYCNVLKYIYENREMLFNDQFIKQRKEGASKLTFESLANKYDSLVGHYNYSVSENSHIDDMTFYISKDLADKFKEYKYGTLNQVEDTLNFENPSEHLLPAFNELEKASYDAYNIYIELAKQNNTIAPNKCKGQKIQYYLFGFIPIWKKVETRYKTKYYLFNFIPFLKVKKRIIKGGKK